MAIPYARAKAIWLTDTGGVTQQFAYTGRTIMMDPRPEIAAFDYSALRDDLAHVEVLLPPDTPAMYLDPAALAYALDVKEIQKVRTPLSQRERLPQVVMSTVIALPPSFEVSGQEALTIARRIALYPCKSHRVPIHIAIHSAFINRHAHADIALRPMAPDGSLGLKIPDFLARFRAKRAKADPVEGTGWPDISWEVQQSFFAERGIDLVVDPPAPVSEYHFDAGIPDKITAEWIRDQRVAQRYINVRMIKTSPTQSIEKIARGRSAIRVAELHRLCARFIDNEEDRRAQVDRILADQNIVSLSDRTGSGMPRYVTTQRVARIIDKARQLIERDDRKMIAVSGADHDAVVQQLKSVHATGDRQHEAPLILGRMLSDCAPLANALANRHPVVGTVDMIMGKPSKRARGRWRHVNLRGKRDIIVPHAELIDDRSLARLILAADRTGSKLLFGHDQSRESGIVRSFLAAHIADRQDPQAIRPRTHEGPEVIERLLRSGLVRHAIEAMVDLELLQFGLHSDFNFQRPPSFAVVDASRIEDVGNAIRINRVRAGLIEKAETLTGPRGKVELSLGEWMVTTGTTGLPDTMDAHQLAQIVAIDPAANWIDVLRYGDVARLDFGSDPAIRPAAAISIRAAWDAPRDSDFVIELADPGRVWAGLLLAANRSGHVRIYVDPSIARTHTELIDAARRSLPAAPPSYRSLRLANDAAINSMLDDFDPFPEYKTAEPEPAPPPPVGFNENVRHRIMKSPQTRLAYRLLHGHVSPRNTNCHENVQHSFGLCSSELTKMVILALAEQDVVPDFDDADFPLELAELESKHWSPWDLYKFELDLNLMTVRATGWGLLPPLGPDGYRPRAAVDERTEP
ncbi:hypothetical protein [uncultured Bradyrhizobium sp.]|uniref:hypothetical protein n=1 Tax=uncultured Bradyrhizobium sp. TaxID=199684 RepID=UPI002633F142|nr:hypothetical protein [uncultured Bradyrhizobium sp.]